MWFATFHGSLTQGAVAKSLRQLIALGTNFNSNAAIASGVRRNIASTRK
jgi:hypothetical protein